MSEEFNHIPLKSVEIDFGIDWGTHVTCSDCGEKIPRGIINWAEHHFKCTHQFTEDAEFEVIPPLMISENKNDEMKNYITKELRDEQDKALEDVLKKGGLAKQVGLDVAFLGVGVYHTDENGNQTRIDPMSEEGQRLLDLLPNSDKNVQEGDATDDDSSNSVGQKI